MAVGVLSYHRWRAAFEAAMARPVLHAAWENLILMNWAVEPANLTSHVPPGMELDTTFDGRAYVSLVAFEFRNTRVRGVRLPWMSSFPEINLRFYVREKSAPGGGAGRRGVCFVREFIPGRSGVLAARLLYNEPYRRAIMKVRNITTPEQREAVAPAERDKMNPDPGLEVRHALDYRGANLSVLAWGSEDTYTPPESSLEHWFKEHEWGFGTSRRGERIVYRVHHPRWAVRREAKVAADVDWGAVYGPEWNVLDERAPDSILFAMGSEVEVYRPEIVRG